MKKLLKMLGFVALYIVAYFAIFKTVLHVWGNVLPGIPALKKWIDSNPLGIVVFNDVIALPLFSILIYYVKKESIFKVTLFRKTSYLNILAAAVVGLGMGVFVVNFFNLPFIKKIPIFEELIQFIYNSSSLLIFTGFVVIGTFFKEILFRGLVFNELRKAMPLAVAIILHAVIYGALFFNFDLPLTIFGTLGNIVVVLTYVITKSIWAPYVAQAANNVCIYVIRNYTGDFFEENRILPIIASTLIIFAAIYFMKRVEDKNSIKTPELSVSTN